MRDVHRQEIALAAALVGPLAMPAGVARADHDMAMAHPAGEASSVSFGVALQAAEFDTTSYVGSYQSIAPSLGWMRGPFGASATIGLYHVEENGLSTYGAGDTMLGGHATVIEHGATDAGVALHVMLPTGSEPDNLGMGHVMAIPSLWAAWHGDVMTVTASGGYGRALTAIDAAHHDHGPGPVVDPMNLQELTWGAGADLALGHGVQVGGRALGGVPIGRGTNRVIGGGRVAWGSAHLSTAFELQLGVAGDPFTVRGVVDTALRF